MSVNFKNVKKFWQMRAKKYNRLEWAKKGDYLHTFLNVGKFHENDTVLDVGTGTGIIAHTVAPFVKKIIGVDISEQMLKLAHKPSLKNIEWRPMDVHRLKFESGVFDKLTARMVFHHIVQRTDEAMRECYRVLKKGGSMILSEGVPPTRHVVPFYTEMFKLKEDRLTFMDKDLVGLMKRAGFKGIQKHVYWSRRSSIQNWLRSSGLPQKTQDAIFKMHLALDPRGKKDYNMIIKNNDCFIDMKFLILTGEK